MEEGTEKRRERGERKRKRCFSLPPSSLALLRLGAAAAGVAAKGVPEINDGANRIFRGLELNYVKISSYCPDPFHT